MTPDPLLAGWLHEHGEGLVAMRRHLHAHPELSWEEHATTAFVAERLALAGLAPKILSCGTGLVCDIEPPTMRNTTSDGRYVALRADLDALAMEDEKDVHHRSRTPGVAHACGHDVHTVAVLGAGLFLAQHRDLLRRPVRLIFQPAEEKLPGGALAVIDDGGLRDVGGIYGLHCDPRLDAGQVGVTENEISSAADRLEITLIGPGGHTARPELTVDLVRLCATIVTELPVLVSERVAGRGEVKVVFGSVRSGDASNVVPTTAVLRGSVRTPSLAVWEVLRAAVKGAVHDVVAANSSWRSVEPEVRIDYVEGVPPVVNEPRATATVRKVLNDELGVEAVRPTSQSWGGDDFAWYLRHVPGTFVRLGVHPPDDPSPRLDLHVGTFDVDELSIGIGVRVLARLALDEATAG